MIKTGMVGNVVLGVGDQSKFNLLGGSFGQAGDAVMGQNGVRRFLPSVRDRVLAAAAAARGGAGGSYGGASGDLYRPGSGFDPDRYRQER